jgi:hypothetical protein
MTARFIAFRSHWQYEASFCTPGEGHEKGGVEGEVGYFRRNHWVAFLAPSSPCTAVADDDLRKLTRENSNFSAPTMNHGLLQTTSITTSMGHNL